MKVTVDSIKEVRLKTAAGMGLCKEALENSDGDIDKAIEYVNKKSNVVSRLHNTTGAKIGLCKIALRDAENDFEKAVEIVEERGWGNAVDGSMGEGESAEGVIGTYLHGADHKTVALVEVNCLTDFVAKNEKFRNFAHEMAMQVAAMKPEYVSKEDISEEELESMKKGFKAVAEEEGKPAEIAEKIVEGKLNKYYEEKCLLSQKWFKDDSKTMKDLLDETMSQLGESMNIHRFIIWEIGGRKISSSSKSSE